MSITDEYVKRTEECERLAGACIAESNRQILIYAAVHWRMLAEELQARVRGSLNLTSQSPRAIVQELEARSVRVFRGAAGCSQIT